MDGKTDMIKRLIEILAKQNATSEEKRVQALIKTALLSDSLIKFINEVSFAERGLGKVKTNTVKEVTEYARAHNEAAIRGLAYSDEQKEQMVSQENNRLTEITIWILGALAFWGLLEG